MVFKKKALKPKKIRAVRQPRAKASSTTKSGLQKEQHTHIINVFNTPHGTHNPYVSDIPFQEKYSVPDVFSTQKFHIPQTLESQSLSRSMEEKPVEITSKNIFPQSVFQVPTSKPKLSIGSELTASEKKQYDMYNPYATENESELRRSYSSGEERTPRGPYKTKGRGSTIEKHQNIGRNIQNEYVMGVETHHQQRPITSFMEVKSTTGSK